MSEKPKRIKKILRMLGIQRISHSQPVRTKTILRDLKDLTRRLGRPWPIKSKQTRKKK